MQKHWSFHLVNEKKFTKFWKGINCTTSFSDYNVLHIIKTNWKFEKKYNSVKELLHQSGNKNAIRDNNENNNPTTSYYKFS